jgi:uncharacterized protein
LSLMPESLAGAGYPSTAVEYTLTLTNTGNITDTYSLAYAGGEWDITLPITWTALSPGESIDVAVQVLIPASVEDGDADSGTIVVTSKSDPTVSGSVEITTQAVWRKVFMPLIRGD